MPQRLFLYLCQQYLKSCYTVLYLNGISLLNHTFQILKLLINPLKLAHFLLNISADIFFIIRHLFFYAFAHSVKDIDL